MRESSRHSSASVLWQAVSVNCDPASASPSRRPGHPCFWPTSGARSRTVLAHRAAARGVGARAAVQRVTRRWPYRPGNLVISSFEALSKTSSARCFLKPRSLSQFLRFWSSSGGWAGRSRSSRTANASESPRPSPFAARASQSRNQEYSSVLLSFLSYASRSASIACGEPRFQRYSTAAAPGIVGHVLPSEHRVDGREKMGVVGPAN